MVEMNIAQYEDYFHDGSIIDINHMGNNIEISMYSAEITENLKVPLSEYNRIKGILYINEVESITCEGTQFIGELTKLYDSASIVDFHLDRNKVKFAISWSNYNPKPKIHEFSVLMIEAKSITWKNIPDLWEPE